MRRLILLRHAKAARHAGGGDHERPLETRGRDAAARMGRWLAEHGYVPDLGVASDALRTRETLQIAMRAMPAGIRTRFEPRIYEASHTTLLNLLRQTPDGTRTLLAVGHNPGFGDMAVALCGRGDPALLDRLHQKFPTAAVAVIDFDTPRWSEVGWAGGTLVAYATPALLAGGDARDD